MYTIDPIEYVKSLEFLEIYKHYYNYENLEIVRSHFSEYKELYILGLFFLWNLYLSFRQSIHKSETIYKIPKHTKLHADKVKELANRIKELDNMYNVLHHNYTALKNEVHETQTRVDDVENSIDAEDSVHDQLISLAQEFRQGMNRLDDIPIDRLCELERMVLRNERLIMKRLDALENKEVREQADDALIRLQKQVNRLPKRKLDTTENTVRKNPRRVSRPVFYPTDGGDNEEDSDWEPK